MLFLNVTCVPICVGRHLAPMYSVTCITDVISKAESEEKLGKWCIFMLYNFYVSKDYNETRAGQKQRRETEFVWCMDVSLADLLQDLAGGQPGDSLQSEQAHREPLRQQTLQRSIQVLGERERENKGESSEVSSSDHHILSLVPTTQQPETLGRVKVESCICFL